MKCAAFRFHGHRAQALAFVFLLVLISRSTADSGKPSPQDYASATVGLLKFVPSGSFQRSDYKDDTTFVTEFRMGEQEVTRDAFAKVMGFDPTSEFESGSKNVPVQNISWNMAIVFCNKLSLLEGLEPVYSIEGVDFAALTRDGIPEIDDKAWNWVRVDWSASGYRLPTEMEWMWAAMGADTRSPGFVNVDGFRKPFAGSDGKNNIESYAWFNGKGGFKTHTVKTRKPNELGIHDLSGNVNEWCWDWESMYPVGAKVDYKGPEAGFKRVFRGGCFGDHGNFLALGQRFSREPYRRSGSIGFRVVRK